MTPPRTDPQAPQHDADLVDSHSTAAEFGNLSILETAAKRGLGPLSELGTHVWHGESKPCVSCGELVARSADRCELCGQDLGVFMLERMRLNAGPWYVMEHIRPFPGVTLERLIKQAAKGVLTRTTVVRGPTTDHQWRFAGETPGLSQFVGCCWRCQADVNPKENSCRGCGADLLPAAAASEVSMSAKGDLEESQVSLRQELVGASERLSKVYVSPLAERRSQPGRANSLWLSLLMLVLLLGAVLILISSRRQHDKLDGKTSQSIENTSFTEHERDHSTASAFARMQTVWDSDTSQRL